MKSINVLRKPENKMLNQLINRSVIANTSVPPRADNKRDWSEALQIRTREAKAALGPTLHIRRVTWHTMILLCAGGEELERQSGGGSTRREVSTLQMGKMAISTQVPGAAHFLLPRRGTPLWLDFPWFLQIFALGGAQWHENNGDGQWSAFNGTSASALISAEGSVRPFQTAQRDWSERLAHAYACVFVTVFPLPPLLFATDNSSSLSPKCVNHAVKRLKIPPKEP